MVQNFYNLRKLSRKKVPREGATKLDIFLVLFTVKPVCMLVIKLFEIMKEILIFCKNYCKFIFTTQAGKFRQVLKSRGKGPQSRNTNVEATRLSVTKVCCDLRRF